MSTYKKHGYKDNLSFLPKCFCGTCGILGIERIRSIYNSNHMLEDANPLIFSFFTKDLTK
jgi:hypothetical protein